MQGIYPFAKQRENSRKTNRGKVWMEDGGSESSPSPLGGENYRLPLAMCWAGHNWADLGLASDVFRVCEDQQELICW